MIVACVYWKGPNKTVFPEWWVATLRDMLRANISIPFQFVCLTNTTVPGISHGDIEPLKHNWRKWWSKIELFRPGLFNERVLYVDLDTIILENITDLLQQPDPFIGLRPFNPIRALWDGYFASGLMAWDADGTYDFIYEDFKYNHHTQKCKGDQDYMSYIMASHNKTHVYWQDLVTGVVSYKRHVQIGLLNGTRPRVVCFHGKPRPWEVARYEDIGRK